MVVVVKHLPFNFGGKVDFVNYYQRALNLSEFHIPITTLTRILFIFIKKETKVLIIFRNFDGRVSIYSDTWSDHWQLHSYMVVIAYYIDNDLILQKKKKALAFRAFDQSHIADDIHLWC